MGSKTAARTAMRAAGVPIIPGATDPVTTADEWTAKRRPELKTLFQHYMYGYMPPPPDNLQGTPERVDKDFFGGKATKREVTIRFGPPGTPPIRPVCGRCWRRPNSFRYRNPPSGCG